MAVSRSVIVVAIGAAIAAGIGIGLAFYPFTAEEKAQGSISSMNNNNSMQSMGSIPDNKSMMNPGNMPFNPDAPMLIPLVDGYYNGNKVFFLHTEVSDEKMAGMMTRMINFPTLQVPGLVNSTGGDNISGVYVFTNGVPGSGPYGGGPFMFQNDVFDSVPGQEGYSNFNVPHLVTWNENATPRVLTSVKQILQAEANGELTIKKTGNIVNAPIVAWKENDGQNRTVSSIDMPYASMPSFDANVTYLNTDQYVARLMLEQKK